MNNTLSQMKRLNNGNIKGKRRKGKKIKRFDIIKRYFFSVS